MQQELAPTRKVDGTSYAFLLSSINPWPMPPSLKKRLQTAELNRMHLTKVTCSMSMTFYHPKSKRFYGSTWVGHEHPCTIKSSSTKLVLDNFSELTYFFTRINDPCCFIVIELIMNILGPLDGSVSERLGCGWAIVNPFLGGSMSNGSICLLGGSPRRLLELKGNRAAILIDQLAKHGSLSQLSFAIWRLEGLLSRAIPLCIKENQIVGAHTSIAGMRSTTINHFDNRGSIVGSCIGANTNGNILEWTLSPPLGDTNIFENPRVLRASNICVTLPRRNQFEKALKSLMAHSTPKESKGSTLFGWKKVKFVKDGKESTSLVMKPKLSIGAHNGNTILRDKWHEVELYTIGDDGDPDRLYAKEDVEINSFVEHDACALLFKVEYLISVQTTARLQSPTKTSSHQTTAVVGLALFFPPTGDAIEGRSAIMLNLENDARCQILCDDPIFSRQEGPDSPQSFVKFELSAIENTTARGSFHLKENDTTWGNMSNDHSNNEEGSLSDGTNPPNDDVASQAIDMTDESVDPGPGTEANPEAKATLSVEVADENKFTSVTVTLRTFAPSESASRVPNSLSFQLKFYAYEEIITSHSLKVVNGIAKFTHPASFSFVYDYSTADTAEELALYLMERDLYIEVFDSSKYLGTLTLPMHLFLRQGKDSKLLENLSVDIIAPIPGQDSFYLGKPTIGRVAAGSIILSIYCVGSDTGITTPKIQAGPKRVIARSFLETSHSARSVVANLYQYSGQQKETDEIISHLPGRMLRGVEGLQRQRLQEEDNMMHDEALGSFFRDITEHGQAVVEPRVLKAIQWARESEKKSLTSHHIMEPEEKIFFIRPWVGQKVIGTYSFFKQLPKGETFKVEASHPGVGIIPKTKRSPRMESARYEQTEEPTSHNDFGEFDLAFECMDIAPITVMVSLVSIRTRQIFEKFRIQVQPRLRVDGRFILACIENEYVRKTLVAEDTGDSRKASIKIVDKTSAGGITTNKKSSGPNDTDVDSTPKKNEVHIEFICPGKLQPFSERFYVLFSHDDFATLHESWELIVNVESAPPIPAKIGWKGVFDFSDS